MIFLYRYAGFCVIFFLISCQARFINISDEGKKAVLIDTINKQSSKINQLKASLDLKARGVLSSFFHEKADILVQPEKSFFLSVMSPFSTPLLIIASNGSFITSYDFTLQHQKPYSVIPITNESYFSLFESKIFPSVLVDLMLNRVSLAGAKNIQIFRSHQSFKLTGEKEFGWNFEIYFDDESLNIQKIIWANKKFLLTYTAHYSDFEVISGIYFPKKIVFFMKDGLKKSSFEIALDDLILNGQLESHDTFYLKPQD